MSNVVVDLLKKRYASRSIDGEPLADEIVDQLVEAVRLSPSCFNNQPWRFLFCQSAEQKEKAAQCFAPGNQAWAPRAPLLVIGYTKKEDDCNLPDGRSYHQFDLGLSTMNLMLAATHLGLVARPMAGFSAAKAKEAFDLAAEDQPLIMLAIGRLSQNEDHLPDNLKGLNDKPRERKEATEVVRRL